MLSPRLDILPAAQRALYPQLANIPQDFVLYGGTAIALRLGHRQSVDFDFFSDLPLDERRKDSILALPWLAGACVEQDEPDTLSVSTAGNDPVKLSFFGGISTGCVATPDRTSDGVLFVASLSDLLAHKLKVVHNRAAGKDYQDIAALLDSGMKLDKGLADLEAMFGNRVPAALTAKALTYYQDIAEAWRVTDAVKRTLQGAVRKLPPALPASSVYARSLATSPELDREMFDRVLRLGTDGLR